MDVSGYDITPTASSSIGAYVGGQANESNADVANSYSQGTGAARGLLNPGNFDSSMGYGDNATLSAIRSRADQGYNRQMNELNTSVMRAADADHIQNLSVASGLASQEVAMNRQKELLAYSIDQANKRARGQILGSVLGIVGGIVGGVYGGPGGAAAGYAAGSGVGEMVGTGS